VRRAEQRTSKEHGKQITTPLSCASIAFYFNTQTAANDFFQNDLGERRTSSRRRPHRVDGFVDKLRGKGITVHVIQDDDSVFATPDSISPTTGSSRSKTASWCVPMFAETSL